MKQSMSNNSLLTADEVLSQEWPEPIWAVPTILPTGLTLLAGSPKIGKSWLGLQIAHAVASGGKVLGRDVEYGSVLYLALEDPPRRIQSRLFKQGWQQGLSAHFMPLGNFRDDIGDLRNGGGERLIDYIKVGNYRLVVIDTLSRSVFGAQNKVEEMTAWLTPIQEMAHQQNCAILMIDHHRKNNGNESDVIADILGSTGKGAIADTILGLYRERNKVEAQLRITGRDVEEQTIPVKMDWRTGRWVVESSAIGPSDLQEDILADLAEQGKSGCTQIADRLGVNKGTVYKNLVELAANGLVIQDERSKEWEKLS